MPNSALASEAELIALLAPLAAGAPGAFELSDDCAQLTPRPGYDLVLKTDPIRAGVHFFLDDPPEDIAWKALAVNISDLAAKGATPLAYLMALSFPDAPARNWVQRFASGLSDAQTAFGCHLLGGDTDRAPGPLSIAITALGEVPSGQMVRRGTARTGDAIFISGTLGDAGLGLQLQREARDGRRDLARRWGLPDALHDLLIARYLRPQPRLELAPALRSHASAAMDISDGLVKDLERMCKASGVGAIIDSGSIEWSRPVAAVISQHPELLSAILSAGDDYEILATVPQGEQGAFLSTVRGTAVAMQRIGTVIAGHGVKVLRADGSEISFNRTGWDHF